MMMLSCSPPHAAAGSSVQPLGRRGFGLDEVFKVKVHSYLVAKCCRD